MLFDMAESGASHHHPRRASSTDADVVYTQLRATKAFDDHATIRLIEARMAELSGANTRANGRRKGVAVDTGPTQPMKARLEQANRGGG